MIVKKALKLQNMNENWVFGVLTETFQFEAKLVFNQFYKVVFLIICFVYLYLFQAIKAEKDSNIVVKLQI